MFEEIKNRIAHLTQTKKEIQDLYLLSNNEIEQTGLSERNMQISMELSFLNKLLQYDVSGRSEQLCIKCKETPANRGLGKHKLVCSDCWNSLCD